MLCPAIGEGGKKMLAAAKESTGTLVDMVALVNISGSSTSIDAFAYTSNGMTYLHLLHPSNTARMVKVDAKRLKDLIVVDDGSRYFVGLMNESSDPTVLKDVTNGELSKTRGYFSQTAVDSAVPVSLETYASSIAVRQG